MAGALNDRNMGHGDRAQAPLLVASTCILLRARVSIADLWGMLGAN